MEENEEEIEEIRKKITNRNPLAFETKLKVIEKLPDEKIDQNYIIQPINKAHHAKG